MTLSVWFVSSQVELAKGRMVIRDKELQVQRSIYHGKLRKESLSQKKKKKKKVMVFQVLITWLPVCYMHRKDSLLQFPNPIYSIKYLRFVLLLLFISFLELSQSVIILFTYMLVYSSFLPLHIIVFNPCKEYNLF